MEDSGRISKEVKIREGNVDKVKYQIYAVHVPYGKIMHGNLMKCRAGQIRILKCFEQVLNKNWTLSNYSEAIVFCYCKALFFCRTGELYSTLALSAEPVAPTINVRELIRQSSAEAGWDSTIAGGGVLSASHSAKVLCGLSQEVDRLECQRIIIFFSLQLQSLLSSCIGFPFTSFACTIAHH